MDEPKPENDSLCPIYMMKNASATVRSPGTGVIKVTACSVARGRNRKTSKNLKTPLTKKAIRVSTGLASSSISGWPIRSNPLRNLGYRTLVIKDSLGTGSVVRSLG